MKYTMNYKANDSYDYYDYMMKYRVNDYNDYIMMVQDHYPDPDHYARIMSIMQEAICAVAVVGVMANMLGLLVLLQPAMRKQSTYAYLAVLAVSDTVVLVLNAEDGIARKETAVNNDNYDTNLNYGLVYTMYIFQCYSSWLLVAVTVDRYIVVAHPLRACIMCTRKRAYIVMTFVFAILLIAGISIAILRYLDILVGDRYVYISKLLPLFFYALLPLTFILVLNVIIIYRLCIKATNRVQMTGQESNTNDEQRITIMLLFTTCVFVLLLFPAAILQAVIMPSPFYIPVLDFTTRIYYVILIGIEVLNYAINTFLYCMTGSKFREEFMNLMCRARRFITRTRNTDGGSFPVYGRTRTTVV